ncbi:TPA: hypothetical protein DIU27_01600 [Candidatus Collierbacteria bacterium]|uniref:DNA-directed DNA polymerase n=1 Tax=Candidatus Collierbacteria bacterium GW2011_GWB2_44_22 TaxID=1618387 RepID=A0A0G1HY05_9BACT|nr:MAG: hypothetical protein UW31_C0008G0004 [Candidatus Collierbacteria bacterium GW2011_GWA2_44_13]KKT51027.1 MAG: hypothetical protein UW42_C0009G0015 [Candidatus Collierbacteria bacterium GW2011_GWB1_44_197]KKT51493.1 MAG: hypothetical protein UW44_C0011G0004 [Candidatus Collierbacteria bacterium GW2011_GWB2_44_22]KKT62230.1 MAG: hypothetical protein UW56_C0009G0004 [Candidatus Collierbacteria bacterium GW2011_GWD1_44_27]KKT66771.1 MAG: hypothetical protein UW58_C0003G0004 [Candidatus Colli
MLIIHGEDTTSSYKRLSEIIDSFKKNQIEVVIKDATELDSTTLRQESQPTNLFGYSKCLIIKNLLTGNKAKQKETLIDIVSKTQDVEMVLFETKKIPISTLKPFSKAKIESFDINPVIFKFVDMLRPGNTKSLLAGWNRLMVLNHEPEYVFAMIVRQIRLLIQAKSGPSYLKLSPYPKKLITTQAAVFELPHLLDLHQLLYEIDKKIKTGSSSLPIDQFLTQFFLKV